MKNSQLAESFERSSSQAGAANLLRRGLTLILAYLMIPIGIGDVYAQSYGRQAPPPPPDRQQQYNQQSGQQYGQQGNEPYGQLYGPANYNQPLTPDELDQLVAPVALYPDALLAQVLAASTYPTQVVDAERWMQSYESYPPRRVAEMANRMPWDPSVKSLTAFPSVLDNLARNLDWTTQLGNAYYNQPQDVMEAVQAMRQQSYNYGYLRSTPQMQVDYSPGYIEIMPANPDVVYVPYYNPWNVYGPVIHPWYRYHAPRPPRHRFYGGLAIGFGAGVAVIAFSRWGWGWGHWRPSWRRREIYHDHDRYISRSHSVFHHGHFGDFDRHYARADFRRDHTGHARGYDRQREQMRGRQNPNFQRAPEYRRVPNRGLQNSNQRQPLQNRQNNNPRQEQQNHNRRTFHRRQQNIDHAPRNNERPQQRLQGRPRRNFNRRQRPADRGAQNRGRRNGNGQKRHPQKERRRVDHAHGHSDHHGNGDGHGHGQRRF